MKQILLCLLLVGCGGTNVPGDEAAAQTECAKHEGLIWWETTNVLAKHSNSFDNAYHLYIYCRDHTSIKMERTL